MYSNNKIDLNLIKELRCSSISTAQAIANELYKINQIIDIDPEMGLVRIRRVLELILRNISEQNNIKVGTKPLEQLLMELAKDKIIPVLVQKHCRVIKEFGNLAAHGTNQLSFELSTEQVSDVISDIEIVMCIQSLGIITNWYKSHIIPNLQQEEHYTLISGQQITRDLIDQAIHIDNLIYPNELCGIQDICYAWHEHNPDIYTMILDPITNQLVGYINAMPLEPSYYNLIKSGQTLDVDIPTTEIKQYTLPDFYFLYFSSIGVHPSYHNTSAFRILYDAFINKLIELSKRGCFMVEILADAVTPEGLKLCKYAGMSKVCTTNHQSEIQSVMLLPPSLRVATTSGKILTTFYQKKYREFQEIIDTIYTETL